MFNRIRVVTMLMMVLGVFALLQLVSGGLLFSSLQQNQQSFVISNDLRQQQSELTSTWDLMLQTRINLSRSSARMMMDASNQQSSAKNDLLKNAKSTLEQAATHYANFKNISNTMRRWRNWFSSSKTATWMPTSRSQPRGCRTHLAKRWANTLA